MCSDFSLKIDLNFLVKTDAKSYKEPGYNLPGSARR